MAQKLTKKAFMAQKLTKKAFLEIADIHIFGRGVKWYGKQFVVAYKWQEVRDENGKFIDSGFTYLFYGYGKKANLIKEVLHILNTMTDDEIKNLPYVRCMAEMPLSTHAPKGLDCTFDRVHYKELGV